MFTSISKLTQEKKDRVIAAFMHLHGYREIIIETDTDGKQIESKNPESPIQFVDRITKEWVIGQVKRSEQIKRRQAEEANVEEIDL